ncbi:hypothetical protein MNV49_002963 [Pseudohyphozyma bogoriensis]|nr:hypothetical protein MNV49_002963 [Pseudohyphozyma bogoriensis]
MTPSAPPASSSSYVPLASAPAAPQGGASAYLASLGSSSAPPASSSSLPPSSSTYRPFATPPPVHPSLSPLHPTPASAPPFVSHHSDPSHNSGRSPTHAIPPPAVGGSSAYLQSLRPGSSGGSIVPPRRSSSRNTEGIERGPEDDMEKAIIASKEAAELERARKASQRAEEERQLRLTMEASSYSAEQEKLRQARLAESSRQEEERAMRESLASDPKGKGVAGRSRQSQEEIEREELEMVLALSLSETSTSRIPDVRPPVRLTPPTSSPNPLLGRSGTIRARRPTTDYFSGAVQPLTRSASFYSASVAAAQAASTPEPAAIIGERNAIELDPEEFVDEGVESDAEDPFDETRPEVSVVSWDSDEADGGSFREMLTPSEEGDEPRDLWESFHPKDQQSPDPARSISPPQPSRRPPARPDSSSTSAPILSPPLVSEPEDLLSPATSSSSLLSASPSPSTIDRRASPLFGGLVDVSSANAVAGELVTKGVTFGFVPATGGSAGSIRERKPLEHGGAFPDVAQLSRLGGPEGDSQEYSSFAVEAQSWQSLLTYLMWHGNSHLEAAPVDIQHEKTGRGLDYLSSAVDLLKRINGEEVLDDAAEIEEAEVGLLDKLKGRLKRRRNRAALIKGGADGTGENRPLEVNRPLPEGAMLVTPFRIGDD